ncbi:MAG TPA: cold shock domain-containing protein [Syntrophales bacterium]|nr:cold shock domain-containing protein [Syntrophales bacterium]HRT61988.1 cold shock domain-containing protein [Syntrophales bacterium]
MAKGTVRWFNRTIGAGFIRTDDGENVLFLKNVIRESDPNLIRAGARVCVEALAGRDGLTATNVCAIEHDRTE